MEKIQTKKMKKITKKTSATPEVKKDWEEYEIFCMKYHQKTHGELTYHWRDIPEKVLFEAGFIHSFNGLRMKR